MYILRPIRPLSSDSSCSICCSYCGETVPRNISSAKRRLGKAPSIFTPLFSQFNLVNMLFNVAVNSFGELVSPCLTPLLILIFSLSLCRCTVTELSVYMSFRISMYTSSIPSSCNYVNIACVLLSRMPARNPRKQHSGMLYSRHFSLSWFMACM